LAGSLRAAGRCCGPLGRPVQRWSPGRFRWTGPEVVTTASKRLILRLWFERWRGEGRVKSGPHAQRGYVAREADLGPFFAAPGAEK